VREFETTFIVQPEISEEGCQGLFDRLDGLFERNDSVRLLFDDQGKRKLAYEIKNFQKGRYVTVSFFDSGTVVPEIERALRLDEAVLRFLTVRCADAVADVDARKKAAQEEEQLRAQRAAERAAREEEEAKARAAAEEARARQAAEDDKERERAAAAASEGEEAEEAEPADEAEEAEPAKPADEAPESEAPESEAPESKADAASDAEKDEDR